MKAVLHKILIAILCFGTVCTVTLKTAAAEVPGGNPPQVQAQTAVVMDADTLEIYYNKDMNRQMYPASITKIMTGLLAAEKGNPDELVTVENDVGKAQGKSVSCIGLEPGEQLPQDSLMYTMFLASANDSAWVLAEHIGGSVDNFVNMMNDRARQLGATGTHFSNPNGLPDKSNYTTAYDMALIARKAISLPGVLKYFGAVRQTIPPDNVRKDPVQYGTIVNMLRPDSQYHYPGIIAAKSGWIVMSGYTLVTAAKRGDRTLICVQLNGDSWSSVYNGSTALFNYGFSRPSSVWKDDEYSIEDTDTEAVQAAAMARQAELRAAETKHTQPSSKLLLVIVGAALLAAGLLTAWRRAGRKKRGAGSLSDD